VSDKRVPLVQNRRLVGEVAVGLVARVMTRGGVLCRSFLEGVGAMVGGGSTMSPLDTSNY